MSEQEFPFGDEITLWEEEGGKIVKARHQDNETWARWARIGKDCLWCGRIIRTQAFMGTDHCCDDHRKLLHGDDKPALTGMAPERSPFTLEAYDYGRMSAAVHDLRTCKMSTDTKATNRAKKRVIELADELFA